MFTREAREHAVFSIPPVSVTIFKFYRGGGSEVLLVYLNRDNWA
jgi:hypothetical protein